MALFQSQSITMETKVSKVQSELGLKPSISSIQPPSNERLGPNEEYNPWPVFDMQTKRKGTVSSQMDLVRETKEPVHIIDTRQNEPLLKKRLPASKPLSVPETQKKLTTNDTLSVAQKKSTYNPDKVTSMMVKIHEQDCSKQTKNQRRSKKDKSQLKDVFTHTMSQQTPMNYIPPPKEPTKEAEKDKPKLQSPITQHKSISFPHTTKRELSHNYKRSRQETIKNTIVNTRPAIVSIFNQKVPINFSLFRPLKRLFHLYPL